jgi:hypothetical protein
MSANSHSKWSDGRPRLSTPASAIPLAIEGVPRIANGL